MRCINALSINYKAKFNYFCCRTCSIYLSQLYKERIIMIKNILAPYTSENVHPGFSVDCVILSFHKGKLRVLLYKFSLEDYWALPGGFMLIHESADQAAYRILESRTGLKNKFLKQFQLFSNPKRTVMKQNEDFVNKNAPTPKEGEWLLQRFISMGYYALVKFDEVDLFHDEGVTYKWYDIHQLPRMYSDHENIVTTALKTIRTMLPVIPVGNELLPEKFTMSELRKIYEIILGKSLDRRNFQRKVLSEGNIIQLDEKIGDKVYNPPILYSFSLSENSEADLY